ncbi:MAG: protein phosphatase CheZ [Alphaproteobacteria bacterium]
MDPARVSSGLHQLVDHLRAEPDKSVSPVEAAAITEVLLTSMQRYFASIDGAIYGEFRLLSERIKTARNEIADLRPTELSQERIPRAGKELEAIVHSTEEASGTIMDAAETIMSGDASDEGYGDMVQENCLRIFEACSFQDLTGQRISKVVDTLTFIENRLAHMSQEWSGELKEADAAAPEGDKALLNGPALQGEGIDQNEVDALLNDGAAPPEAKPAPKAETKPAAKPAARKPAAKPVAKAEAPKTEAPKAEAPKAETPKAETPKPEAPKAEAKPAAPKAEAPKPEAPKAEARPAAPKAEAKKPEPVQKPEAKKPESAPKPEAKKPEPAPKPAAKKPEPVPEPDEADLEGGGEKISQDEIDALFA